MNRRFRDLGWWAHALLLGGSAALLILADTPIARAACPGDAPLTATLQLQDAPTNVTFDPSTAVTPKLKVVLQLENCSGGAVFTTDGFSSTDFFRRLYFTAPNGGTITNKAEETLHADSPVFFCLSRKGVLLSPALPVVPVEALAGPGTPFALEYVIDDARASYDLTQPGRYSVNARIPLLTFDTGDPTAVLSDCDQFEGTTVVNVGAVTGRHEFTVLSNTLEFSISAPPPTSLVLSPATASMTAGASRTYGVEGRDAGGHSVGDVTAQTTFTIDPDGSCTGASCTASTAGPHTVTGHVGAAQGAATLTINVGALDHITMSPTSSSINGGASQSYTAQGFDAFGNSLGDVTSVTTFSISPDGSCTGASCTASTGGPHTVTANDGGKQATATLTVNAPLNSLTLGAAKVWIGLANTDDVGIKFDLQAIVRRNSTQVGSGQLASVLGGGGGFTGARLDTIALTLTGGPTTISSGDTLSIELFVRNACSGSIPTAGRARLWFNGQPIDTGATRDRDAGTRFGATIGTAAHDYFLRTGPVLSLTAGSARAYIDRKVVGKCGPYQSFGTWSLKLP